jgi:hypothetical protein
MIDVRLRVRHQIKFKPADSELNITAAFCMEVPITEVWATIDISGDDKIAVLNETINQLAYRLVPQEEHIKSYSFE